MKETDNCIYFYDERDAVIREFVENYKKSINLIKNTEQFWKKNNIIPLVGHGHNNNCLTAINSFYQNNNNAFIAELFFAKPDYILVVMTYFEWKIPNSDEHPRNIKLEFIQPKHVHVIKYNTGELFGGKLEGVPILE